MSGEAERLLRPGERLDDLQRDGLCLIQNPAYFRFGMDAVLLSDFVTVHAGDLVTDLCTGSGVIPLLLSAKTKAEKITGIELQPEMADMAERSVRLNGLCGRIRIVCGDLRVRGAAGEACSCQAVTCNPPYIRAGEGLLNPEDPKALARHEIGCTIRDCVQESSRLLKHRGRAAFVYRPRRLPELLSAMEEAHLSPRRLRFVHAFRDREANLVLAEGVKGGGRSMSVEPPLILYDAPGVRTEELCRIYGET